MEIIAETEYYKIYWHDDEKTVLISEINADWTWAAAHNGLEIVNKVLGDRSSETDVYSIVHMKTGAQMLPKSGSTLINLRNLLRDDPQHERLVIYVAQGGFFYSIMQVASTLAGIGHWIEKYRFVNTLEEALLLVSQDKNAPK